MIRKCLFLDRDGVICEYLDKYLIDPKEFKLLDGIQELIKDAKTKGFSVVVVTNQPQVGKKLLKEEALLEMHQDMEESLGGLLDRVYYCPHIKEDNCLCRKPKPGLLLSAQEDLGIDLTSSWLVGDSHTDIEAGKIAGCRTIFVKNKYNTDKLERCSPHYSVSHLSEIIEILD